MTTSSKPAADEPWFDFMRFLERIVPEEHRAQFDKLARANSLSNIHLCKRCVRYRQQCEAVTNLFMDTIQACYDRGTFDVVKTQAQTLLRLRDEFNAPLPTIEELEAELLREVEGTIARR